MNRAPQILGYIMARNEWPLLGAAIMHALSIGVDRVVVLDHASDDSSSSKLKVIQEEFPDRLIILRLNSESFFQEAATSVVGELVQAHEYDWIYVFDADEFLLVNKEIQLKEALRNVPAHIDVIRYRNEQWVAPYDLNESDVDSYFGVCDRAIPNLFINLPGELIAEEIEGGNLNYFDVPFPTKVMVRGHLSQTIAAGSHFSRFTSSNKEMEIDPGVFRLAHLPFRSYRGLERKAEQGRALVKSGFPTGHGWQSQLLYKLQEKGMLEEFWRLHSSYKTHESNDNKVSASFASEEDWDLADVLRKAFGELETIQISTDSHSVSQEFIVASEESAIPISISIGRIHGLSAVRDELIQQRDELTQQRDELTQQRDELVNSTIWKLTKPLRKAIDLFKK